MSGPWYDIVNARDLEQGDVLIACPIPRLKDLVHPLPPDPLITVEDHDVVVLTQTCDLVQNKVEEVLLGKVWDYRDLVAKQPTNQFLRAKGWRTAAINGHHPSYSIVPAHPEEPALGWALADFHNLFTLPKSYLLDYAERVGDRLRLRSPYREHLAQAFARYVMRVGLPSTFDEFEKAVPS